MQSIVDYEFQLEDIREINRKKLETQKQREERIIENKTRKSMDDHFKRKMKELEKQRKINDEEDNSKKKLKEKEDFEKFKIFEEIKKKEINENDYRRRLYEQKIKDEEFKKQIEDVFILQQSKLIDRQDVMNHKDLIRKKLIENKRLERIDKTRIKSEIHQRKIETTIYKMEQRLIGQRNVKKIKY